MPRLIAACIRHGAYQQLKDTPSALQPYPLTATGFAQARNGAMQLKRTLDDKQWSLSPLVDSSRLLRAWQTADTIVSELAGLFPSAPQITTYDELAERSVGSVANLSLNEIEDVIHNDPRYATLPDNWKSDSHFCLPFQGAESLMQAGERVANHLQQQMRLLAESSTADTVKLFVGHGASFRHAAYQLGILKFADIAQLSMHHAQPVFIEYLPEQGWRHIAGEWKIRNSDTYID